MEDPKENITVSVPLVPSVLRRAEALFKGLAEDCEMEALAQNGKFKSLPPETVRGRPPEEPTPPNPFPPVSAPALAPTPAPPVSAPAPAPPVSAPAPAPPVSAPAPAPGTGSTPFTVDPVYAAPATPGVDLDADGLPWSAKIHAGSKKKKKKDGKWKLKKGVDPALVETVEAELRAVMAVPAAATLPEATPPAATSEAPGADFANLVSRITAAEDLTEARVHAVLAEVGLPDLSALGHRPDLIPSVLAKLFPGS